MNNLEIKKQRKRLKLTQAELAEMIGVSENTIYNYEKGGKIPQSKIAILRKVFYDNNVKYATFEEEKHVVNENATPNYNAILIKVEAIIKRTEALKDATIDELASLKKAYDLREEIKDILE